MKLFQIIKSWFTESEKEKAMRQYCDWKVAHDFAHNNNTKEVKK